MSQLIKPVEQVNDTCAVFKRVSNIEPWQLQETEPVFNTGKMVVYGCVVVFVAIMVMGFRGWL